MVIGQGFTDRYLTDAEVSDIVRDSLDSLHLDGKRVLIIIPDGTRSMPMPLMFSLFHEFLDGRVQQLDYLVALGTHQPMNDLQLGRLIGTGGNERPGGKKPYLQSRVAGPGKLLLRSAPSLRRKYSQITNGLMAQDVPVRLNKIIFDYDQIIICGPVFPHEVVGFSGGNKYFFPGIAGPEIINFTHWLGAVITNYKVIGAGYTPVRAVIDRAAAFIDRPKACFALVVTHAGLAGMYFGSPEQAWQSAAELSARKHIVYVDKPFQRVLSIMPEMYDDLWTAAKGMYKMEPAVADGGEIVIYAPHLTEVSYTHGKLIDEIGYHCRDYFMKQWDKFKHYPGGVLAHSTHVRGLDRTTRKQAVRLCVSASPWQPASRPSAARINLGYLDPDSIRIEDWQNREDQGILVVPRAGEMLYRIKE